MRKAINTKLTRILMAVGILLVVASVVTVTVSYVSQNKASANAAKTVLSLQYLMPEIRDCVLDDRVDMTMPMLQIDGLDFVGIVEVPAYEAALPIFGTWDRSKVFDFPCRYTGSIYDGSLIIGGSDNQGQFDFMKVITGGDILYVTDTTGARYTYVVTEIEKTNDVSTENLNSKQADLVLFARSTYNLDYTVVHCEFKNK